MKPVISPVLCLSRSLLAAVLAAGLVTVAPAVSAAVTLDEALTATPGNRNANEGEFAFEAIREIGHTYGMRGGLAWGTQHIAEVLEAHAAVLDRTFNFQPLVLEGSLVPPVLVQTTESYDQRRPDLVVLADSVYRIERPERLRYNAPNWREYLLRADRFDARETGGWAPRNDEERALWTRAVKEGWNRGVEQAYELLEVNFARLSRDLRGMILYRKLVARNMLSEPVVAQRDLGVTGNESGTEMNVNERVVSIDARSRLNRDPATWNTSTTPRDTRHPKGRE